ncbi:MAG: sulfatase-like hydrolase/transferase, partial [Planctomycetota bacterium]
SSAIRRVKRALLVGFALLAALSAPGIAAEKNADERPNILFLLTDDQRADTLNCMGHSVIRTPHLDALAASGVLFRRAFVTDPTCKPSRTTYFTGQYERVHRVGFSSRHTMILYTSDHGLLLGEYGMGGKGLCYDLTTQVPLVVFDPRLPAEKRGRQLDDLVLSIDLAPTILSLAGVPVPDTVQGRDLTPLVENGASTWRDAVLLENLYLGRDGPIIEAVRTRDWKYVRHFKPGGPGLPKEPYTDLPDFCEFQPDYEQLFDLKHDPGETKNLAAEERHRNTLEALRRRSDELSRQAFTGRI